MIDMHDSAIKRFLVFALLQFVGVSFVSAQLPIDTLIGTMEFDAKALRFSLSRSFEDLIVMSPGGSADGSFLYLRGGMRSQIGASVDGFSSFNPYYGGMDMPVIFEAVEKVRIRRSAFNVGSPGSQPSGIEFQLRTGSDSLVTSLQYISDRFGSPGTEFLSTTIQGYRSLVATAGGPITSAIRFFVAGEMFRIENKQPLFLIPFSFPDLVTDGFGSGADTAGTPLPGPVSFEKNFLSDNYLSSSILQGTVSFEFDPMKIHVVGSIDGRTAPLENDWPFVLERTFVRQRALIARSNGSFLGVNVNMPIGDEASFSGSMAFSQRSLRIHDPDFGNAWELYPDSAAHSQKGRTGFTSRYSGPAPLSTIYNFEFEHPSAPHNSYLEEGQSVVRAGLSVDAKLAPSLRVVAGARQEWWTMKKFSVGNIAAYNILMRGPYGGPPQLDPASDIDRFNLKRAGQIVNYGYTVDGIETEQGQDPPIEPTFSEIYGEAALHAGNLNVNLGLKRALFNSRIPVTDDLMKVVGSSVSEVRLQPKLFGSYAFNNGIAVHAAYTTSASLPPLIALYDRGLSTVTTYDPYARVGYDFAPIWGSIKPIETIVTEFGITYTLGSSNVRVGRYWRSEDDFLTQVNIYDSAGEPLVSTVTLADVSRVIGGWELSGVTMVGGFLNIGCWYHLEEPSPEEWRAEGAQPRGYPENSISGQRQHTIRAMISFDSGKEDFGEAHVFGALGVLASSGLSYTRLAESANIGQSTLWNIGTRNLVNARYRIRLGPIGGETTPWISTIDAMIGLGFGIGTGTADIYLNILNVTNVKNELYVYPGTGKTNSDGWLESPIASQYRQLPHYEAFYRSINYDNRWAYMYATGKDLFGQPRQIRLGMRITV